ncbi:hypothetical protein AAY473_022786 [Plecturocebus cupreus]
MGPAEPDRPVYSAVGSTVPGAGKRAAPAKRVTLATHVAPLPGISRSVGNKNSSESWSTAVRSWLTATSASRVQAVLRPQPPVARITGTHHHNQLIFVFSVEMGFCPVGQADLELLTSSDPPASASQRADRREPLHPAKKTFYTLVSSKLLLSLCSLWFLPFILGDSQQRRHTGHQRDSFGRRGCFAGAPVWRFLVWSI